MTAPTPFDNCKFQICDLPGQCQSEGKCHHPKLQSQPVPVEPDVFTIHDDGHWTHLPGKDPLDQFSKNRAIKVVRKSDYDSLQSALQRAQEERDQYMFLSKMRPLRDASDFERAEKAEATNRRMVELMKEPSEGMIKAGIDAYSKSETVSGLSVDIFSAMSAELLKEVEK